MSDPLILDTLKNFLTAEVLETLFKKCKSFLKSRMLIQESLRTINFDSDCDDFKKLIEDAFKAAASKEICKKVPAADLIETLKSNIDSITGWVYFPSPKFDMEVLKPANYDYEKEILAFLNILYEQIKSKRDSYISFTMPQIRSLLKDGFDGVNENIKQISNFLATQYTTGVNEIKQTILGLAPDKENVKESWSQDEHFPKIESLILSRDYKKAFELLKFIKESVEKENIKEKKVKLYELYIMYFLREETHQEEALPYIERLLENQIDNERKQYYIVLELILSKEYNKVIEYIDAQFKVCPESKQKVKNELFELRINALLLDKRTDEALNYVNNIRKEYKDSLYWLSRIYNLMGRYENAVKLIKENSDYFNIDFNKKLQKIESCYLFFVQKYSEEGYNPSNFEKINKLIAESILLAEEAKDDFKATETILLAQAMLYRIISDNEKSLTAFEKLKEIGSQNPNFLRNYPIELIQTHANLSNAEKELILNYFRKFLSIYPEDNIIHDAYYVTWLNTDECKATEEIERLPFVKQNLRSKILLINVYVKHFEIDKAERLIGNLEIQFPDCSELNIARKNLLVHKKNLPEAIKECEKALEKCKDKLYRLDIIKDLLRLKLSVQNLQLSQIGELVELINSVENEYERLNLYGYELVYCRMYQKKNDEAIKVIKQIRSFGLIKSEIVSEEIFINFTTRNYQKVLGAI